MPTGSELSIDVERVDALGRNAINLIMSSPRNPADVVQDAVQPLTPTTLTNSHVAVHSLHELVQRMLDCFDGVRGTADSTGSLLKKAARQHTDLDAAATSDVDNILKQVVPPPGPR